MDIVIIQLERASQEELVAADSNKESNSISDQHDPKTIIDDIDNSTKVLTTSVICLSSISHSVQRAFMLAVFTSIAMVIGILTVYYTSPKPPGRICTFVLKSEALSSIAYDSHPHSVAVGDFNNDGRPDIVVPNSGTNNIGVFIRHGNDSFTNQMTYSTGFGSLPYAVAVGDFNKDQRLDIAVANFGTNNIGVLFGIGNGTFTPQRVFSTESSRPRWVAVGDFNNDTQLDIVVVNYGTNNIGILLGDGNGNFANQITFFTGFDSVPYTLAVADLNHDNKLDIVVANYGTNNIGVLLGLGNGSFGIQTIFSTGINSLPYSVAINELNNDTHMDIVVVCSGSNNVGVLLGFGNGTFTMPTKYSTGNNSFPLSVAIGDFDNDNKLDIAVANYGTVSVGVFFGYGNGSFEDQMTFFTSTSSNPYSIGTGDFNNDTLLDIAIVNFDYNYVDIILTYRNYSFLSQTTYPTTGLGSNPQSIALADFNNDGRLDIIVANYGTGNVGVFLAFGDANFSNQVTYSTGIGSAPYSINSGDFNNDNRLDIVVANYGTGNIGIFLGYGNGTFSNQMRYSTGTNYGLCSVAVGDFNGDSLLDIVVANFNMNSIAFLHGYVDGTFLLQSTFQTGSYSYPHAVAVGDFNNDNRLDIVVANYGTGNIGIFLGYGNGTFSNQTSYSTGNYYGLWSVAVGDFNGDSLLDIVVANKNTYSIGVLLGYGNGSFSLQSTFPTGNNTWPLSVGIGDFNNDSQLDIVVANYGTNNVGILLGHGNASFSIEETYSTGNGSNPFSVAVGDLNNDGWPDIAVANDGTTNAGVLVGYGNGSFRSQKTYSTRGNSEPQSVVVADFNDDSRLDIVVVNYYGSNVDVFLGYGDGTFSSQTSYSTGKDSSPYSVAVGDFNNDNRLDMVVTTVLTSNIGIFLGLGDGTFLSQTTYSTGSNSEPCAVAVGDINNDTRLDIVVANYVASNVGIFLGNSDGSFSSQRTFSTGLSSEPRSVVLVDCNNDKRLDIIVVNYATDNVGVFLGYGDGNFSNPTSYFTPPGSRPYSAAVGDLNNDGQQDIVVTVYYTRSIVIFFGFGNGTFANGATYSTGSDSRPLSVTIADLNNDNRMDIIVTNCASDNIVVFLGDGDGTFSNERNYPTGTGSCPQSVAFGDFNRDSLLDIVVGDYGTNIMGVFLGSTYMNGVFGNTYSTGSSPHPRTVALGDFNKDAQLDVAIANYQSGTVGVLLGYLNGTFPLQTMFSTGALSFPTSVAVGHLNNDSELDITVTDSASESVGILLGYGNGSFASPNMYPTGFGSVPQCVVVGDFNNDQKFDIAVANSGTDSVFTLLRYDIGAFKRQIPYLTGTGSIPRSVSVGDFNSDGRLDFVVVNSGNNNVGVFLGLNNDTFSNQTTYFTGQGSNPWAIAVADFNKDDCLDIVVTNLYGNNVGFFLGFCNGTFSNQTTYATGYNSGPIGVTIADLNNDSRLDLVITLQFSFQIGIFYGYGDGTFSNMIPYSTGANSYPISVAAADLNKDNRLDIVVTNYGASNIVIFYGYGNGTLFNLVSYSTGNNSLPQSVAVADFNKDSWLDLVVTNSGSDNIGVFFGNDNGAFFEQTTFSTGSGSAPYVLAVADLNNDSQLDVVVSNYGNGNLGVLLGCVNGSFFSQLTYSTGDYSEPDYLALGDFNGDGRLDVIVANSGTNNVGVFFGYVNENYLSAPAYSTGPSSQPTSIAVADFDNDTRLDIVVANNGTDNVMILFGSGYGTFVSQTTYSTGNGSQPCWVAVGDFNNDNRVDFVVANSGTNSIGVFLGNGTRTFSSQMIYSTGVRSQPYSVAVGDFNNDTLLDIAVASYGANSVGFFPGYGNGSFMSQQIFGTGFGSRPFALVVGDVNNDRLTDIVATNNGYGNIDILMKTC